NRTCTEIIVYSGNFGRNEAQDGNSCGCRLSQCSLYQSIMKKLIFILLAFSTAVSAQKVGLLKYNGGGDWYSNPTALPNLIKFCNRNINTGLNMKPATVDPGSPDLFDYPFVHMTGHGNVVFSDAEIKNLRNYLEGGGFLHIDDNYGMDQYIRREIKRIFPDNPLVEIPANHQIFQKPYSFPGGIPKIH